MKQPLLAVDNLAIHFGSGAGCVRAVDGVSFYIDKGETVALVGESGSGKSMSALAVTKITPRAAQYKGGRIRLNGLDVLSLSERDLCKIRGGRVAYIFQEPMSSFNPVCTIEYQIKEALRLHQAKAASKQNVIELLDKVQLPERLRKSYPHEMSGGQLQRCMIAMALACSPDLLIADEPTTALDVTIQRDVLNLIATLTKEENLSVLMITHNFGIVSDLAHRIYVMQKGRVVESGKTKEVLYAPLHSYTQALMKAVPRLASRGDRDASS